MLAECRIKSDRKKKKLSTIFIEITKREAEVLFWVANDKSNAAIAKIFNCSQGTVRKRLEHIYQKLGVQTRTAAVMVALEKLGLLKSSFVAISS